MFTTTLPVRQCAALPLRRTAEGILLVGLITSRGTGRWVLPKGWLKDAQAPHETAVDEAREEAGLLGAIETTPIGSYRYRKTLHLLASVVCEVDVFKLHVTSQLDNWPEKHQRTVAFYPPEEAAGLVQEADLRRLLESVARP